MYARTELSRLQRLVGFLRLLLLLIVTLTVIFSAAQEATVYAQELGVSGHTRMLWNRQSANPDSPVTRAAQLLTGLLATSGQVQQQVAVLDTELHMSARGLSGVATVRAQTDSQGNTQATAWINELYGNTASADGAWQFSAGKKIVAWDVGYGFPPNDMVQQEKRRTLLGSTVIGRNLAMAEYFNASLATALVWVNPTKEASNVAEEEQALAARVYYRAGAADLHGFTRYGMQTGASAGTALAWVAPLRWNCTPLHGIYINIAAS